MSQPSSYLATLERHRKTFAILEEYQEVAEQLLELTRQCLKSGGKVIFMGNPDEKQQTSVDFGNDFSIHFHGCLTDPLY